MFLIHFYVDTDLEEKMASSMIRCYIKKKN